jgi:hypothetical protein
LTFPLHKHIVQPHFLLSSPETIMKKHLLITCSRILSLSSLHHLLKEAGEDTPQSLKTTVANSHLPGVTFLSVIG